MRRWTQAMMAIGTLAVGTLAACDSIPTNTRPSELSAEGRGPRRSAVPLAPASAFGVGFNGNYLTSYETNFRAAQLMYAAGVRHARVTAYWYELQQGGDNTFTPWAMEPFRAKVQALLDAGITPYVTLMGTACFARELPFPCDSIEATSPPKDAYIPAWQTYVGQMVDSFPEVTHWGIWNEPNAAFLHPDEGEFNSRLNTYAYLVVTAAPVIRARGRKVVGIEMGDGYDIGTGLSAPDWVQTFMTYYGQYVDVVAVHLYSQSTSSGFLSRMGEYAQRTAQAGYPNVPLWLTEVGDGNPNPTDAVQEANLTAAYQAMSSRNVPQWAKTYYHDAGTFTDPVDNWGLVRYLGTPEQQPRPAYYALQRLSAPALTITGLSTISRYAEGTWGVRVAGGSPPYTYFATIDGTSVASSEPWIDYANTGTSFRVRFRVTDSAGITTTATKLVTVGGATCLSCPK